MKVRLILICLLITCLTSTGCADKLELDETTISLIAGVDKGENDTFMIYQTNPVFSKEAQKKTDVLQTEASTIREARKELDGQSSGNVLTRKLQVFLVSKEVLEKTDIFPYLNVFYRDAKNAINARVVMVNGKVKDIVEFDPPDKPRISIYISELIDTTKRNESTVRTTFQRFSWQNYEKGITPMLSEIKLQGEEIEVTGTALLTKNGLYATSLDKHESALLLLLRRKFQYPVPLTFQLNETIQPIKEGKISMDIHKVKYKLETSYRDGRFEFMIDLGMDVIITENLSGIVDENDMSKQLEQAFKRDMDAIVKKIQHHELSPFGLGVNARADEYEKWKEVEDDWPKAVSKANITVKPKVNITGKGIVDW